MNRQSSLRFAVAFVFAAFAVAAIALADFGALAQNSNSSTTAEDTAQNANANAAPTRRGRGRRGRRAPAANDAANANTGDATMTQDNGTPTAATAQGEEMMGDLSGERADLSGTYAGHVTMSGGHDMDGQATLTITGNTCQMSGEGMNHGGRVYAVLTRGEISAAFYFTDLTDATTNTPVVANVRVRKRGDRMTLRPAPNARTPMTFTTGGGAGTPRPRRPRRGRAAPAAPDANANTNTTPPR
ncbi:MAG TPA: hypothetical protein VNZ44_14125 [Pyrinomonadaceae bacterium]|nr:hypothetical protein [Pyrinomonadaceae bacterium]